MHQLVTLWWGARYKNKLLSLLSNLQQRENKSLRDDVLGERLDPDALVRVCVRACVECVRSCVRACQRVWTVS